MKAASISFFIAFSHVCMLTRADSNRRIMDATDPVLFNQLFEDASLHIPGEYQFNEQILFSQFAMTVRNIVCYDIHIGDVTVSHAMLGDQRMEASLAISNVDLRCIMDYQYVYTFLSGEGKLEIEAADNSASTLFYFDSEDFNTKPPFRTVQGECVSFVKVTSLDFEGDSLSNVFDAVVGPLTSSIEKDLKGIACDELKKMDADTIDQAVIQRVNGVLEPYQIPLTDEEKDPLSLESNLSLPSDLEALNLQDTDSPPSKFINDAIDLFVDALTVEEGGDLAVNEFIRSIFLDSDGSLVLTPEQLDLNEIVYETHNTFIEMSAIINQIKVIGLDSLSSFNPLQRIGKYTLKSEVSWKTLAVEIDVTIDIKPSSLQDTKLKDSLPEGITDRIKIYSSIDNIDLVASLLLVINEKDFDSVTLGLFLRNEKVLSCLFNFVPFLEISGLDVNPAVLGSLEYKVSGDPTIAGLAAESLDAMYSMYEGILKSSTTAIFQKGIRSAINELIDDIKADSTNTVCNGVDPAAEYVDFRQFFNADTTTYSSIPIVARDLLNAGATSLEQTKNILAFFLSDEEAYSAGNLIFDSPLFNSSSRIEIGGFDATIALNIRDTRIENLDSIGFPIDLLSIIPEDPHILQHMATFGVSDRPLRFATKLFFSLIGDDNMQLSNDLDISLDAYSVTVIMKTMIQIVEARLNNFPLRDILNYNCWIAMVRAPPLTIYGTREYGVSPSVALEELAALVATTNFNISCLKCTSPRMAELVELFAIQEAQEDFSEVVNGFLEYISDSIGGNFFQIQIDRLLYESARQCPHNPEYDQNFNPAEIEYEPFPYEAPENDSSVTVLMMLLIIASSVILAITLLAFAIQCLVRRRHGKWLKSLPPDEIKWLAAEQHVEKEEQAKLNAATNSMFTSPHVPLLLRFGMPIIILGNIAFFLSGHLSLGGTINIDANIAGEKLRVDQFFEFSMARSTIDIWNAGGKELAILIVIFSGIWPYSKQIITLVVWFLPPSKCSVARRGSIFLWLDRLGKWSMVDIFVLVISIAAFRVSIVSPSPADFLFMPKDFYNIEILVVPLWGLYANMIAQLISQVTSHFIIYYHRRIVKEASKGMSTEQIETRILSEKAVLYRHQFGRPHREGAKKLVVRWWVNGALLFAAFCAVCCVIIGCIVPSFSLEILGILGLAVESGQNFEDATIHHNCFTVVQLLFDEAKFLGTITDYIGLGTLSVLFVWTVLLIPILQIIVLLRQWFFPSTGKRKVSMLIFIEVLQAWQYSEVYIISIFVATWQLGPLSEFMINVYCASLEGFFGEMVNYGLLKEEDAQCFSVKSTIEGGSYSLLVGAILLALINLFVYKAVNHYFLDRKEEEKREKSTEIDNGDDDMQEISMIYPVPVLFTDTFRWMVTYNDRGEGAME